ncbi:MAG TPA: TetR family transcriptional regulator [Ktedonobacterales bacterium]
MDIPDTLPAGQYIIYALVDPTDGLVRYVGQTNQPEQRLIAHLRTTHHYLRDEKAQWMRLLDEKAQWVRLLEDKGQKPRMQVLETVIGKRMALTREKAWIRHFQDQGMALLNARRGPGTEVTSQPENEKRQRREERILDAAASLFARSGYLKTRLADVADKAGVGSAISSQPWRDKRELFQAAIFREKHRVNENIKRRIATDPAGESFHRVIAHSLFAILSNPLMAAILTRQSHIFTGELKTYGPDFMGQLVADFDVYIAQLQDAGLIRVNFPVPVSSFLLDALKIDITNLPDLMGQKHMPSMEQLTEAISDLLHHWLDTKQPRNKGGEGDEVS